ncbi:MAG: hypothetical protein M0Z96_01450 [Actinomycetota bacterium]|nr:hypothetical protein [Actinomycetota bacterium]
MELEKACSRLFIAVSGSGRVCLPSHCRSKESEVWGMIKMCVTGSAIDIGDVERTSERRFRITGNGPAGAIIAGEAQRSPFSKFVAERCGLRMSLHVGEK